MPTQLTNHIAAEVRAEMARQRVTQIEMAAWLGMSQSVLSRLLNGRTLTVDFVVECARVLDVPISKLTGDVDEFAITPVIAESSMLVMA